MEAKQEFLPKKMSDGMARAIAASIDTRIAIIFK